MSDILLRPIIAVQVAVHQLREREDGQTTTEYAILLGFLAIAIIVALFFLRDVLRSPVLERGQQRLQGSRLSSRFRGKSAAGHKVCADPVTPSTGSAHTCCKTRFPRHNGRRVHWVIEPSTGEGDRRSCTNWVVPTSALGTSQE